MGGRKEGKSAWLTERVGNSIEDVDSHEYDNLLS